MSRRSERVAFRVLDTTDTSPETINQLIYERIITRNLANILNGRPSESSHLNAEEEVIRKRGRKVTPKIPKQSTKVLHDVMTPDVMTPDVTPEATPVMISDATPVMTSDATPLRRSPRKLTVHETYNLTPQSLVNAQSFQSSAASSLSFVSTDHSLPSPLHDYNLRTPIKSPRPKVSSRTPSKVRSPSKTPLRVSPRKRLVMNSNDSGIEMTPNERGSSPIVAKRIKFKSNNCLYRLRSTIRKIRS